MYTGELKLTNNQNLPLALSNNFDETFSLIDEVKECKSPAEFCNVANKYHAFKKYKWKIDKDSTENTRLAYQDVLGNVDYLIANKSEVVNKVVDEAYRNIDNFREKLGEIVVDKFMEEDNFSYEIAKSIISAFDRCETKAEYDAANNMLIAIVGWSIETLIENIKERDNEGFSWESC